MKRIKSRQLRAVLAVAVGMCLSGAVHAQTANGNIVGQARSGATITVTSPETGVTREIKAQPNGSFTVSNLPPGRYRVVADGATRDVTVAGGSDARVAFDSAQHAETVTITGSRIARDTFNSVSPVQIITREETTLAGFNSTASILQSTAVTAGGAQINNAFGGFVTDGGPGANTIGLRGLGTTRTLVLLNGRRVAPAGSRGSVGAADLNVLPNSIVDHIEILKDGASSIYGSDAVAGVINIITKKNIQGVTLEAQYNKTEEGGGDEQRYSATAGTTFDRGFLAGSAELYRRSAITWNDRSWMKCQTDYLRTSRNGVVGPWGSGDFIDPLTGLSKCYTITSTGSSGVTINTIGTGTLTGVGGAGTVGTSFNRWRPNSAITTGLVGFEGVGGGANSLGPRDTFEPRMMNQTLISPAELKTGFMQGAYDLKALGDAEAYFELLSHKRESKQVGYRQLSLDYARGSPLIPAGLATVPNLQSAPTVLTYGQPLQVRAFIGFGNYNSAQDLTYNKATAGIRGNLPWSDWKYDLSGSWAKSEASYMFEQWLTDRLAQSMDVVASGGGFACRNPANGCVAAPVISSQVIGGVLPRNWVDWTFVPDTGNTMYKETTVTLGTTGTLFELKHGRVRSAVGFEYRRAEIDDTPSINMQTSNVYNFSSAAITRGKDSVWELYGELEVPVLAAMPFAEELTVNVSGRHTDYKSYGADNTYKAGALYSPVKWLSFRGSQGTSYRAPALYEQFLGSTSGFLSATGDPCNNWGAGDPNSVRSRNCASEGLPGTFSATSSIQSNTIGGANAGLKAETSKNLTLGLILQPDLPSDMGSASFAVDYYKIKVDNGVDRVGTANILTLCYNDPNAFSARGGYCRLVTRAPAGTNRALIVDNSYINVATDVVRGYDFTLRYSKKNVGPGDFLANAVITKYLEQSHKLFPDDPLDDQKGRLGRPKLTASLDLQYKVREWKVRWGIDWIDSMSMYAFYGEDPATSIYLMETPSYALHTLSLQYTGDKWSATAGVRNLSNKLPPPISAGFANRVGNAPLYSGFDYFGRTFFLNVTKSF